MPQTRAHTIRVGIVGMVLSVGLGHAWAQMDTGEPRRLPYEGHLDLDGVPQTGSFDFRFALFASETADTTCLSASALPCAGALWSEERAAVAVNGGAFAVTLGEQTALEDSVLASPALYLAIAVRRGVEPYTVLQGLQQLLSVPFAARAAAAKNYAVSGNLTVGENVTVSGQVDVAGRVTAPTLVASTGVTSPSLSMSHSGTSTQFHGMKVSNEYAVSANNSLSMTSTATSMCFLTKQTNTHVWYQYFSGCGGTSACSIGIDAATGVWVLTATRSEGCWQNSSSTDCSARCIEWSW